MNDNDIIASVEASRLEAYLNRPFEDDETCELCECTYAYCSCSPRELRMYNDPDAEYGGHDNPYQED